jgi:hypothetical protein
MMDVSRQGVEALHSQGHVNAIHVVLGIIHGMAIASALVTSIAAACASSSFEPI